MVFVTTAAKTSAGSRRAELVLRDEAAKPAATETCSTVPGSQLEAAIGAGN